MTAKGYFTIERNIMGLNTSEIESTLGFRPGRFDKGVIFLELLQRPTLDQFEQGGSTRYSARKGLKINELTPRIIPFAWTNQRLVKIEPIIRHTPLESYPAAPRFGASEQWLLKEGVEILAREICTLQKGDTYWGRGKPS